MLPLRGVLFMSIETSDLVEATSPCDARALQLRLYREVGLAAVEAILGTNAPIEEVLRALPQQNTATLAAQDQAAQIDANRARAA